MNQQVDNAGIHHLRKYLVILSLSKRLSKKFYFGRQGKPIALQKEKSRFINFYWFSGSKQ